MSDCLSVLGPGFQGCSPETCSNFMESSFFHAICNCIDWQGNPIPDCMPKTNYPVQTGQCQNQSTGEVRNVSLSQCAELGAPWIWQTCYCCCLGGYAAMTVAAPSGQQSMSDIAVGSSILVAHNSADGLAWHPAQVAFSVTAPPTPRGTTPPIMIRIDFGNGQTLVASPAQLFLLPSGKLKRADQLVPGTDALVDRANQPLPIHRLSSGLYGGATQHVATTASSPADWDGSLDGHLIELNGVVAGDYLLDLLADSPKLAPHLDAPDAPKLGSPSYQAAAPHLVTESFAVGTASAMASGAPGTQPFAELRGAGITIPHNAIGLFSPAQETLLAGPIVPKRVISDQTNVNQTDFYIKLFSGFFPDVTVKLDWASPSTNIFCFNLLADPYVVISGGFLRLEPIYGDAVAATIAFGIANRTIPADANNVGHSLYDGIGTILPQAVQGANLSTTLAAAQKQFDDLIALIEPPTPTPPPPPPPAPTPTPTPPPATPATPAIKAPLTATCMGEVINAAISGGDFPACAH